MQVGSMVSLLSYAGTYCDSTYEYIWNEYYLPRNDLTIPPAEVAAMVSRRVYEGWSRPQLGLSLVN